MKKKLVFTMLALTMGLTLFAGGTLAWFTAQDTVAETTFTAGTLTIDAEESIETSGGEYGNINPGDTKLRIFEVENTGSKRLYLRAKVVNPAWTNEGLDYTLTDENVSFSLEENSGWLFSREDGYYYYGTRSAVSTGPSYTIVFPEGDGDHIVTLPLEVKFDGPTTGNDYQDQTFTFDVIFEAIQITNHGDGVNPWTNYTADGLPTPPPTPAP